MRIQNINFTTNSPKQNPQFSARFRRKDIRLLLGTLGQFNYKYYWNQELNNDALKGIYEQLYTLDHMLPGKVLQFKTFRNHCAIEDTTGKTYIKGESCGGSLSFDLQELLYKFVGHINLLSYNECPSITSEADVEKYIYRFAADA